jgi:hypothetical protein
MSESKKFVEKRVNEERARQGLAPRQKTTSTAKTYSSFDQALKNKILIKV